MFYELNISKTIHNTFNLTQTHIRFKRSQRLEKYKWHNYDNKLDNSISRARSSFMAICDYNNFYYFYTQTISSKFVRNDLKLLQKKFNNIVKRLRRENPTKTFNYVYIPEFHSDNENIHIHGFLSHDFNMLEYVNKNGYKELKYFDKIGYNSVEPIKNHTKASIYMSKYITKDIMSIFKKGDRIFYCSRGLLRKNLIKSYYLSQIAPLHFDFKNMYVFKTSITQEKFMKLEQNLEMLGIKLLENSN